MRFAHHAGSRFRCWAALILGLGVTAPLCAQDQCRRADVMVPAKDLRGVLAACEQGLERHPAVVFAPLARVLVFDVCGVEYADATRVRREMTCIGAQLRLGDSVAEQAIDMGLDSATQLHDASCAAARRRMEQAWRLGARRKAAEYLYMSAFQGDFRGLCGPQDLRAAAHYLSDGAAAGNSFAQGKLAQFLLADRFPALFQADNAYYPPRGPTLLDFLDAKTRNMDADRILQLLTEASAGDDAALPQYLLIRVYQKGLLGEARPDLALAWAAQRSVMSETDAASPDDDGERYGFDDLFASASDATKASACRLLHDWSLSNLNFRIAPGDIKNRFALACFDPSAILNDEPCLTHAEVAGVEQHLKSLLERFPQCRRPAR